MGLSVTSCACLFGTMVTLPSARHFAFGWHLPLALRPSRVQHLANFQHAHTKGGGHLLPWWQMGTRDCSLHESILKQGLAWACDAAQRRQVH